MTNTDHFGVRIKQLRLKTGLTLQALGDNTGTSKSFLCAIEKGKKTEISAWKLYWIAQELNTTVEYLLTGKE